MIDGVKIDVPNLDIMQWIENGLLDFNIHHVVNLDTGEVLNNTHIAHYKGLKFIITPSTKYKGVHYCSVRGSLHKYYNNGNHNANDFTFQNLQEVIAELRDKFQIDPSKAIIRNLEFGVNIVLKILVKTMLKNIVAYGGCGFMPMTIDNKKIGKVVSRSQYKIKVYDKGKQCPKIAKENIKHLVRFEISVKKMAFLKSHSINTLEDLMNPEKVQSLGKLLLKYWADIIYFDKKIDWRKLTEKEQKKMLYYATPRNWEDFDRQQRTKAKKRFKKLILKSSENNHHSEISNLIANKLAEMEATETASAPRPREAIRGACPPSDFQEEKIPTQRKCLVCSTSIEGKRVGAVYCSKRCNNKKNYQRRKAKRKQLEQLKKERYVNPVEYRPMEEIQIPLFCNESMYKANIRSG